jgi:hypothetical protein
VLVSHNIIKNWNITIIISVNMLLSNRDKFIVYVEEGKSVLDRHSCWPCSFATRPSATGSAMAVASCSSVGILFFFSLCSGSLCD